ncbi:hypothetical protein ACFC0K_37750 [Streptomyces hydrogenans]|uniref:hypothetical protein n=1 Tax=Streptomyces hydrogenans TaxID=1873719 RepID=UPI0035E0B3F6
MTKLHGSRAARHKTGAFNNCSAEKAIGHLNALAGDKALLLQLAFAPVAWGDLLARGAIPRVREQWPLVLSMSVADRRQNRWL